MASVMEYIRLWGYKMRGKRMAELIIFVWFVAVLVMLAGFIIGFTLGRLKGMNDAIESKEMAQEYVQGLMERSEK